jgi:hypothetical protein
MIRSPLVIVLLLGCGHAPAPTPSIPSVLPPVALDVESLVPPAEPAPAVTGTAFETVPLEAGRHCTPAQPPRAETCQPTQAGLLLSEQSYARAIIARSDAQRLGVEVNVLRNLRTQERAAVRAAEAAWAKRLSELEREVAEARGKWWLDWVFVGGFVLGAGLTAATAYGAAQAVR